MPGAVQTLPRSRTYVDPTIGAELQRLQDGPTASALVVDGRVVLAETSVRIRRELGPLAVDAWLAMNAVWVEEGFSAEGLCSASMKRLARLVWPRSSTGGKNNRLLRQVADRLYEFSLTADDFDIVTNTLRPGALSKARLITELTYDRELRLGEGRGPYDPVASGVATGRLRDQSLSWRFSERYVKHAREGGLLALDLELISSLDGVAKTLWVQMRTPRFPFRPVDGHPDLETCSIALTPGNLGALGVSSSEPKQQRRTLRAAGRRIVDADPGYVEIDCDLRANVLRIVRRGDYTTPMVFPDHRELPVLPPAVRVFTPEGIRQAESVMPLF